MIKPLFSRDFKKELAVKLSEEATYTPEYSPGHGYAWYVDNWEELVDIIEKAISDDSIRNNRNRLRAANLSPREARDAWLIVKDLSENERNMLFKEVYEDDDNG